MPPLDSIEMLDSRFISVLALLWFCPMLLLCKHWFCLPCKLTRKKWSNNCINSFAYICPIDDRNSHEVLTLKSPFIKAHIEHSSSEFNRAFLWKLFFEFLKCFFFRSTETSDPSITPHSSLLTIYRLSDVFQCDLMVNFDVLWVETYRMSVNLDVAIYLLRGFLLPKIEDFCLITTTT